MHKFLLVLYFLYRHCEPTERNVMKKVKVIHTIWGNFNCFVGSERVDSSGHEFDAKEWLVKNA